MTLFARAAPDTRRSPRCSTGTSTASPTRETLDRLGGADDVGGVHAASRPGVDVTRTGPQNAPRTAVDVRPCCAVTDAR